MAALGNWPTCFRCTVNSLQVLSTVISLVLNCIASLLSIVASHCAAIADALMIDSRAAKVALTSIMKSPMELRETKEHGPHCRLSCNALCFHLKIGRAPCRERVCQYV